MFLISKVGSGSFYLINARVWQAMDDAFISGPTLKLVGGAVGDLVDWAAVADKERSCYGFILVWQLELWF